MTATIIVVTFMLMKDKFDLLVWSICTGVILWGMAG